MQPIPWRPHPGKLFLRDGGSAALITSGIAISSTRTCDFQNTGQALSAYRNNHLEKYILPEIGEEKVAALDSERLERFISGLQEKGKGSATINKSIVIIQGVLDHAEQEGYAVAEQRTMRRARLGKKSAEILREKDRVQLEKYLLSGNCPESCGIRSGVILSLYMGLRIGEVCALKWENIDLEREVLSVENTLSRIYDPDTRQKRRTCLECDRAKTENSRRQIPLPKYLKTFLTRMMGPRDCFVLTGSQKPMEPRVYSRRFGKVCCTVGIPHINYHALRHTFATRCVEAGFDIKALSEILGHASASTTMEIYVHPTMEAKLKYLERLEEEFTNL